MKRFIAETVCFYLLACVLLICLFSDDSGSKIKNAEVNDIVFTIKKLKLPTLKMGFAP